MQYAMLHYHPIDVKKYDCHMGQDKGVRLSSYNDKEINDKGNDKFMKSIMVRQLK